MPFNIHGVAETVEDPFDLADYFIRGMDIREQNMKIVPADTGD
jgi:hypothetical protein